MGEQFEWDPEGLGYEHEVGSLQCEGCWRQPRNCESCTGGVMHSQFGDENADGDY